MYKNNLWQVSQVWDTEIISIYSLDNHHCSRNLQILILQHFVVINPSSLNQQNATEHIVVEFCKDRFMHFLWTVKICVHQLSNTWYLIIIDNRISVILSTTDHWVCCNNRYYLTNQFIVSIYSRTPQYRHSRDWWEITYILKKAYLGLENNWQY